MQHYMPDGTPEPQPQDDDTPVMPIECYPKLAQKGVEQSRARRADPLHGVEAVYFNRDGTLKLEYDSVISEVVRYPWSYANSHYSRIMRELSENWIPFNISDQGEIIYTRKG